MEGRIEGQRARGREEGMRGTGGGIETRRHSGC